MESEKLLLLDACCVINLFATGRIENVLRALPYRCAGAQHVLEKEVLSIGLEGGEAHERERADLSVLVESGSLEVMSPSSDEEKEQYVRFAHELDEGEAQTCALALVLGGAVATDDRKALRLLEREGVDAVETAALLHYWARATDPGEATVGAVLRRVENLARFRPRSNAPFAEWWFRHSEP